jgi:hypothetical protein
MSPREPVSTLLATPTPITVAPVTLPAPDRGDDLQLRVSAPSTGTDLPVIVFSHGFGSSMEGSDPLRDVWVRSGFAVLQPTHLDSRTLALAPEDPRTPQIWRYRIEDLTRTLDELDLIEASVPGLAGRLDRSRIAIAGHSWGATTASALLGARIIDQDGHVGPDMTDRRITAGALLALAGTGGDDLTPFAAEHFAFMNPDFAEMAAPALLVAGDHDQSPLSHRGPDWWLDGYRQSPAPKSLLTLFGAEHSLGGVTGYDDPLTTDENPQRVALVAQATAAYLRDALGLGDGEWAAVRAELGEATAALGTVQSR